MTAEEKRRVLRTDFLDRDQATFVHIRRTGRLGWESMIPEGGSYSDILTDGAPVEDLIRQGYRMAGHLLVAMDTPYKVTVRLSPDSSCTDSKVVYVATKVFDDPDLSTGQKLDTFLGLAIHEGCHLRWTDFGVETPANRVIASLRNIIEDERIERLCGEEMPGYANFLIATKYYYFDRYRSETSGSGELPAGARLLNAVLAMVRYPKSIVDSDLEEFIDPLYEVREVLKAWPVSTAESHVSAERIYKILRRWFEKDSTEGRGGPDGGDGRGLKGAPGKGAPSEGTGSEGAEVGEDAAGHGRGSSADAESRMEKDLGKFLSKMESISSGVRAGASLGSDDICEAVRKDSYLLAEECEGKAEGAGDGAVFRRADENTERYLRSLSEVRRFIPAISRSLQGHCQEYRQVYRGMRSGALDTSKLAEGFQGVQNVYIKEGLVRSSRLAVCILVDESGSMIREGRMPSARSLAVLLNEAVAKVPGIDLYMYGHSADETVEGRTDIRIYREKGFQPRHALGSLDARDNNRDGVAILQTARRVRRFTSEPMLMFVISDGAPAAQGYIGREAIAHTKACVEQVEKMGVSICQVAIQASYDPGLMFSRYVRYEDMSSFAPEFAKMVKKAIMKCTRRVSE